MASPTITFFFVALVSVSIIVLLMYNDDYWSINRRWWHRNLPYTHGYYSNPYESRRRGDIPDRRGDNPDRRGDNPDRRGDIPDRRRDNPDRRGDISDRRRDNPDRRERTTERFVENTIPQATFSKCAMTPSIV